MPDVLNKEDEAKKSESKEEKAKDTTPEVKKESKKKSGPYEAPEGGFGGFDGEFSTKITDEESKISIRRWAKYQSFPKRKMVADQIYRI